MFAELARRLSDWQSMDTWIVVVAALSAMACALPGVFLVLRRQSMMGDALSHTSLPGIAIGFLALHALQEAGWISPAAADGVRHLVLLGGAIVVGVLSSLATEWVHSTGRVEATAALGVVFTSLFALGLLLIRLAADQVHLDPDCVLYGNVELVAFGTRGIPPAAWVAGGVLLVNGLLVALFYKELKLAAFDPALAASQGVPVKLMHYGLMAMTAVTLVSAFEIVGSILVIAALIVPAATALVLSERLGRVLWLSLVIAALTALLGHAMAISVPPVLFGGLGLGQIDAASTSGMMAVAGGLLFAAAVVLGPRRGVVRQIAGRWWLTARIAAEDVLGSLYRQEENPIAAPVVAAGIGPLWRRMAFWKLQWEGKVVRTTAGWELTTAGRQAAEALVRSHRLWESYVARHFQMPDEQHLHHPAERAEHFIDRQTQAEISAELSAPETDPHGRAIPPGPDGGPAMPGR